MPQGSVFIIETTLRNCQNNRTNHDDDFKLCCGVWPKKKKSFQKVQELKSLQGAARTLEWKFSRYFFLSLSSCKHFSGEIIQENNFPARPKMLKTREKRTPQAEKEDRKQLLSKLLKWFMSTTRDDLLYLAPLWYNWTGGTERGAL